MASLLGDFLPISKEQIIMLMEGNVCDSEEVFKLFEIDEPITFSEKNLDYLNDEEN